MTESISFRDTEEATTSLTEIAAYRHTGMQHLEDAASVLAHAREFGSCALLGVDITDVDFVKEDIFWLANHAHNMKVLSVDHVIGSLHGPATSKTFRHIDEFAHRNGSSGLIVFNNIDVMAGANGGFPQAQEVAAKYISRLMAHGRRPKICAISGETPADPRNEQLLGVFASYVVFSGSADEEVDAYSVPYEIQQAPTVSLQYA